MVALILSIINSLLLIYILYIKGNYSISFEAERTRDTKVLFAYTFRLWQHLTEYSKSSVHCLSIPIRNKKKEELKEDIADLKRRDRQDRRQRLRARFSWLKTIDKVEEFKNDYYVADPEFIDELVTGFKNLQEHNKHKIGPY